ncbi:MAG: ABC transporter substrate-binding protein [Chloroflexi bacterium]|nr:ABC transporter substrate-binding protein [Chloroflexota bacterium]
MVRDDPYNHGQIVGDVADRWQVNATGDEYTFFLRQDVKWSDGKQFTAADVTYNVQRYQGPTSTIRGRFTLLDKIVAVDDFTVKMTLKQPSAGFLTGMSDNSFRMYPAHVTFPDFNKNPLSTGAFKATKFETAIGIETVRNPTYFRAGKNNLPYLDGVRFIFVGDPTLRASVFRTGQVDASGRAVGIQGSFKDAIQKDVPGVQIFTYTLAWNALYLNNAPPFNDPRVLEAINLALDRQELGTIGSYASGFVGGVNVPASVGGKWAIPEAEIQAMPGYRQPKDQDLARARQLLAAVGASVIGQPLSLLASPTPPELAVVISSQLTKVGFNVNIERQEFNVLIPNLLKRNFQMAQFGFGAGVDDPTINLSAYTSPDPQNYGKWLIPDIDRLHSEQDKTFDSAQRKRIAQDLERTILRSHGTVTTYWSLDYQYWRPEIRNLPQKGAPLGFSNVFDWSEVWIDK